SGELTVPDAALPTQDTLNFKVPLYGMATVGSLFTDRQLLSLLTFCKLARQAHSEMLAAGMAPDRARAVATYIGMAIDRVVDRCCSLRYWDNSRETTASVHARQALPMVWDFAETNPFSG